MEETQSKSNSSAPSEEATMAETTTTSNNHNKRDHHGREEVVRPTSATTTVTLNVGGTEYTISTDTIMKCPETMLGSLLSKRWNNNKGGGNGESGDDDSKGDDSIFIDRDPVRFRYILDFYRDGGTIVIPCTMSREEILREAEYFALPITMEQIHFDGSDLACLRNTIANAEDRLIDKFKQEAHKRAVVAAAYELAAIHIDKLSKQEPAEFESTGLAKEEIPQESFARALCPDVLNDPAFKKKIRELVKQAGFSYGEEINSDEFTLCRRRATSSSPP